jgi:hypothetical protein
MNLLNSAIIDQTISQEVIFARLGTKLRRAQARSIEGSYQLNKDAGASPQTQFDRIGLKSDLFMGSTKDCGGVPT